MKGTMKTIATFLLTIFIATSIFAQESSPVQNVQIGELVKLEVPAADSYKWYCDVKTNDFLAYNGDRNAVFSGRTSGTYKFICAYYSEGKIDLIVFVVNVKGPPKEPTNTSNLDEWIPYWLGAFNLPKDQAEALAVAFDKTSLQIKAGMTPEQIIPIMAAETKTALGTSITPWVPFLEKIKGVCENRTKDGKLSTPADHIALFGEISKGLRTYQ